MDITRKICDLFDSNSVEYKLLTHPETLTSEASRNARIEHGAEDVVGAKALVIKTTLKTGEIEYNVFVLPGNKKLNSKAIKRYLNVKSISFATAEILGELTGGLVPGSMPPFANAVFPELNCLFIDNSLLEQERIGFNAGSLRRSLIVNCSDYVQIANPKEIFDFAN